MRHENSNNHGELPGSNEVKTLARDAKRVISGSARGGDAIALLSRIDRMSEAWGDVPSAPIRSWLKNLRREIEDEIGDDE